MNDEMRKLELMWKLASLTVFLQNELKKTIGILVGNLSFLLKVHRHEIFLNTFFAETESLWFQEPVTRDF
jgi:hypothetical protein